MTQKQQRFVAAYLLSLNAAEAARQAGYSKRRANQAGHQLLTNSDVSAAIKTATAAQLASAGLSAARVLEELRRIALLDPRGFFTRRGRLKPVDALTAEQASALASSEIVRRNLVGGDGHTDMVHKIRFWDKVEALKTLAKYFGLIKEADVNVTVQLAARKARLAAAYARGREAGP